jgi:formiminotetrahydrofolate cyclodeaminase
MLLVTDLTLKEFTAHVSRQKHAMAGAVIAASAAEAVALGQACLSFSQDAAPTLNVPVESLDQIRLKMLTFTDRDANAIAELVAMRAAGQELQGRQLLCQLPADLCHACIQAAQILQDFRPQTDERVRDDLEMSIRLLSGTAGAAMLLLDSNLRHWPDLAPTFEPILADLLAGLETIQPVKRIRNE